MKINIEESKRIRAELNKINERSNQICRILDKDDIDINFINDIGKKKHKKTTINNNILPNLIYYQGKINNKENYAKTFYNKFHKKKKNLVLNDFHTNFFKILKGNDNEKIIKTFFYSENYPHHNDKIDFKAKKEKERKLQLVAPELVKKKKLMMERLPFNYKKYRKNYEYKNNQLILDETNEQRYKKYDEPFKYPLNEIYSNEVLPKYNNLFFKYKKNKIRDYFYRKTLEKFHSKNKNKYKFKSNIFES